MPAIDEVSSPIRREPRAPSHRRLFFALWPDAVRQTELVRAARAALDAVRGGRRTDPSSLHLTLAFLGEVLEIDLDRVRACASRACAKSTTAPPGLEVTLDALEYWPRSQVLCATESRPSADAAAFAEALKDALRGAGLGPDLKPFRAHVTLVRRLPRRGAGRKDMPRILPPVRWTFPDFVLVESRPGPRGSLYSILESWPLFRA